MPQDYLDRVAAVLPAKILERYLEIKSAISTIREKSWELRQQLVDIAREYGIPDIDHRGSTSNKHISKGLNAVDIEINSFWASASPDWTCPCCGRSKSACARLGSKRQMLGKLVAHHDHIADLIAVALSDLSRDLKITAASAVDAQKFLNRGSELFERFDRIVICEDCNNADAKGKALSGADTYFTFTPREISTFIRATVGQPHDLDDVALAETYSLAKQHYDRRVASIRKLAGQALAGTTWYEPVASKDRDDQLDREAQRALGLFGLDAAGCGTVRDIFFPPQPIDIKYSSVWRTARRPGQRTPTESELEFVIRGNTKFAELPNDWICQCCARPKRDLVRWSQNAKKFSFSIRTRNVPDEAARYGRRQIKICDACDHIFQESHKELRLRLGNRALSDYPIGLDEVRSVIIPKRNCMHDVDAGAAERLLTILVSTLTRAAPSS